jgi:hypothetical protein
MSAFVEKHALHECANIKWRQCAVFVLGAEGNGLEHFAALKLIFESISL